VKKHWRSDQDRNGSAKRRQLEFDAVMDQVRRRKEKFVARLNARLEQIGACLCYRGSLDQKGYARLNLSYWPSPKKRREIVTIHAHRLFLIMKLQRPIKRSHEAGHLPECEHRTCVAHLHEEHYKSNAATNGGA
jgi:hypothetical protein